MVARTSPACVNAFFATLAATGNQTLAAERAKVSRSWVTLHRSADPAFGHRIAVRRQHLNPYQVGDAGAERATVRRVRG